MTQPALGRCEDDQCGELVFPGEECSDCWHAADLIQHAICCDRAFFVDDSEDED